MAGGYSRPSSMNGDSDVAARDAGNVFRHSLNLVHAESQVFLSFSLGLAYNGREMHLVQGSAREIGNYL